MFHESSNTNLSNSILKMFCSIFLMVCLFSNVYAQPSNPDQPTGNGQYCKDLSTIFYTNNVSGAVTYEWNITPTFAVVSPASLITNDPTIEITWNTVWGGSMVMVTVIACDSVGVCSGFSPIFTVNLGLSPTAGFIIPLDTICASDPVVFSNTSVDGISFLWDFGDNTTSTGTNPLHQYEVYGQGLVQNFNVQLIAMNGSCSDTVSDVIYIREMPELTLEDSNNNSWQDCNYSGSSELTIINTDSTANNISSYAVDWGDGTIENLTGNFSSLTHTYNNDSTFTIEVIVTNSNGCSNTETVTYAIGGDVFVGVSGSYTNYCAPHYHEFQITNYTSNSSGTIYKVWFGDGIYVPPLPPQTQDIILYGMASDDTLTQQELDMTGGLISHYYGPNSCDYYKFWVLVDNICDFRSQASPVFQITRPIDNDYLMDSIACIDEPVTIFIVNIDSCFLMNEVNYIVNWGDSNIVTYFSNQNIPLEEISHTYTQTGFYEIIIDALPSGVCDTVTISDTLLVCVETAPIPDFNSGVLYCVGDTVFIDNQTADGLCSGPPDYDWGISPSASWVYATGSNSTSVNPELIFLSPGSYDITLTTISCNSAEGTQTVEIIDVPEITVTQGNTTYCGEQTISINTTYIDNGDPISDYQWSLPSGVTVVIPSTLNDPVPILNFPMLNVSTDYYVTVTATNSCGITSEEVIITINPIPVLSFSVASNNLIDSVCSGDSINYELLSNLPNTDFYWEATINPPMSVSGIGANGITDISTVFYTNGPGSSLVTIIVTPILTDNGFTCNGASDTILIDVHPLPIVDIGPDLVFCANDPYDTLFTNLSGGIWNGPGIINSSLGVFNPGVNSSGTYNIIYNYTNPVTGCSDDDEIEILVNAIPLVNAGTDTILCNQNVTEILDGYSPLGGIWSGPGITNSIAGEFTPNGIGIYEIFYEFTNSDGCTSIDNKSINVIGLTEANIGQDTTVCVNIGSINLSATPVNGIWSGSGVNSIGGYLVTSAGDFEIYYSIGAGTCYDEDTIIISVNPLPDVDIGPDLFYCISDEYDTLQANYQGGNWVGNGITNSSLGIFNPGNNSAGNYQISYTYTHPPTGCTNTDFIILTVYDLPIVDAGSDTILCNQLIAEPLVNYSPFGGSWSGNGITSSSPGEFTPNGLGIYEVYYDYTDNNGCYNQDTLNINVIDYTEANAGQDTAVCENILTINLTGIPLGGDWFGNGMSINGEYSVGSPGFFEFYYGFGTGTCYDEDTVIIIVDSLPNVNIGPDLYYCITDSYDTLVSNYSGGQWSGYGIIDTILGVFNPGIDTAGIYNISYIYTELSTGCTNNDNIQLTVFDYPVVNAGNDTILCNQSVAEQLLGFGPSGGNWSGIGITNSTAGEFTPNGLGIYELYYDYTDIHGCYNQDTVHVNVIDLPIADAGQDTAVCGDLNIISLVGFPLNGIWSGSGISSTGDYTVGNPGSYEIYYSIGAGTCYDEDTISLTINTLPVVDIGPDLFYCISDINDTLYSNFAGGNWSGYGIIDAAQGIFNPGIDTAGIYNVTYTYTESSTGCTNYDEILLTIYDLPVVNAGNDTILCNQSVAEQLMGFGPSGGNWSGIGISNTSLGEFTPNGIGLFEVYYGFTDNNGCYNQDTVSINVIDLPVADAGQDTAACENLNMISLTGLPLNGIWSGSGISSTGDYTIGNPGNYEIYYSIGAGTCHDEDTISLTINSLPIVDIGPDLFYCISDINDTLYSNFGGGSWSGYGIIDAAQGIFNPGIDTSGIYSVTYTYTESSTGCTNYDEILLTIYDLPVVNAGNDTLLCNQSVAEQLLGFDPSGGNWSGIGISNSTAGEFTPNGTGLFEVYYGFTDNNGCYNQDTVDINVIDITEAIAGDDIIICEDIQVVSFNGVPAPGNWFGNNISNTGFYQVVTDSVFEFYYSIGSGTCYDEDTVLLTVNPLPEVNIGSDLYYCISDQNDTLFSNVSGGQWDGVGIIDQNLGVFNPGNSIAGTYQVIYFYTNPANSCSNEDTVLLTVYSLPDVNAGNDTILCNQSVSEILNTTYTTPNGGSWSGVGITNTSTGEFTPSGVGLYEVYYSFIDSNTCSNEDTLIVDVIELTLADAGQDTAICEDVVSIILEASPSNGDWSGNGISNNGVYQINQSGDFVFYYSIGAGSCFDEDSIVLTVNPLPIIDISPSFNICFDADTVDLLESPYGGLWTGTGITNDQNGIFNPLIANIGTHALEYSYTIDSTGCTDQVEISAFVRPVPISAFDIDSPLCRQAIQIPDNQSSGADNYEWFFDNISFSNQFEPDILFPDTGIIDLMLISSTQYGCDDTSYTSTYVIDIPAPAFTISDSVGCEPLEVGFLNESTGDIDNTFWVFGNGDVSIQHTPNHIIYTLNGPLEQYFIITLNESNECGDATIIDSVLVYSIPEVNFGALDSGGCVPYDLDLSNIYVDVPLGGVWDFGDGTTSGILEQSHLYTVPGVYDIEITVFGPTNCLINGDTSYYQTIIVYDNPNVSYIPESNFICEDDSTFIELIGAHSYQIQGGGTDVITDEDFIFLSPDINTTYTITGTNIHDCIDDTTVHIVVEQIPVFDFGYDTCMHKDEYMFLNTGLSVDDYIINWSTGEHTPEIIAYGSHNDYCVEVIPQRCPIVEECIIIDYCAMAGVPNAFSPNGDHNNDILFIEGNKIIEVHLQIYNRQGIKVFETRNREDGWYGTYQGEKQPIGVYVYSLWVKFEDLSEIVHQGNISLLR